MVKGQIIHVALSKGVLYLQIYPIYRMITNLNAQKQLNFHIF